MSEFRRCSRCGRTRRLEDFYRYRAGEERRRTICRDCSRETRDIWLTNAPEATQARYYENMKAGGAKRAKRVQAERARDGRDRTEMTQGLIRTMRSWGMTYRQIAEGAGMGRTTVSMYDRGEPVQYTQRRVLDRLGRFYQQELEKRKR